MSDLFYELPVEHLVEGLSTSDGQDIIGVQHHGGSVSYTVYTPRPDDPDADAYNMSTPETRIADRGSLIQLAVFDDTPTNLSTHPAARNLERR